MLIGDTWPVKTVFVLKSDQNFEYDWYPLTEAQNTESVPDCPKTAGCDFQQIALTPPDWKLGQKYVQTSCSVFHP